MQSPPKLRVLCLHSWRTSGDIFLAQWRRAGLDVALADLVELVRASVLLPRTLHSSWGPGYSGNYAVAVALVLWLTAGMFVPCARLCGQQWAVCMLQPNADVSCETGKSVNVQQLSCLLAGSAPAHEDAS